MGGPPKFWGVLLVSGLCRRLCKEAQGALPGLAGCRRMVIRAVLSHIWGPLPNDFSLFIRSV